MAPFGKLGAVVLFNIFADGESTSLPAVLPRWPTGEQNNKVWCKTCYLRLFAPFIPVFVAVAVTQKVAEARQETANNFCQSPQIRGGVIVELWAACDRLQMDAW